MKLLFDQNLSFKLCHLLADVFPDSAQVRRAGLAEADDRTIWDYAAAHGFVRNKQRDRSSIAKLRRRGWRVLVIWECKTSDTGLLVTKLRNFVRG